jgi:hypothetical protein
MLRDQAVDLAGRFHVDHVTRIVDDVDRDLARQPFGMGMAPLANSACTRSSNSRMVRIWV